MREVVDLPDTQLAALDAWRAARGMSRAEAIKQAVNVLIEEPDPAPAVDQLHPRLQAQIDEILTLLRSIARGETPNDAAALAQLKQVIGRMVAGAAFGLWHERPLDGLAEQERLRAEWDDR